MGCCLFWVYGEQSASPPPPGLPGDASLLKEWKTPRRWTVTTPVNRVQSQLLNYPGGACVGGACLTGDHHLITRATSHELVCSRLSLHPGAPWMHYVLCLVFSATTKSLSCALALRTCQAGENVHTQSHGYKPMMERAPSWDLDFRSTIPVNSFFSLPCPIGSFLLSLQISACMPFLQGCLPVSPQHLENTE